MPLFTTVMGGRRGALSTGLRCRRRSFGSTSNITGGCGSWGQIWGTLHRDKSNAEVGWWRLSSSLDKMRWHFKLTVFTRVFCSTITGPFIYFFYCHCKYLIRILYWFSHSMSFIANKNLFPSFFIINYFLPAGVTRRPQVPIGAAALVIAASTSLLGKRHLEMPLRVIEKRAGNDHLIT